MSIKDDNIFLIGFSGCVSIQLNSKLETIHKLAIDNISNNIVLQTCQICLENTKE